ncbi:MAG: transketolase C-terminal domain-containing protein [Pseudobdellovibrionaceae bacterium]
MTTLFSNPKNPPHFSKNIQNKAGQNITVSDPKAIRALVSLMDMNAVLGGAACHYGGPAALAELMSAVHALMFEQARAVGQQWHQLFHFVNDAGHCENGLYALKANYGLADLDFNSLKKFRSIESPLTGHGEVHCFPEGVFLSNGPLGSAVPQTQGLALGEKINGSNRTTVAVISDGASMEGEAKEAFAAIPGWAQKNLLAPYVLIITDNNTKLSGRISEESFDMAPTFASLRTLGWHVIDLPEGNDLEKCYQTLQTAIETAQKNPAVPVAVHAKTIKGIGSAQTAKSSSGGHGFPLKAASELPAFLSEIYNQEPLPAEFIAWIAELQQQEKFMAEQKLAKSEAAKAAASAGGTTSLAWSQVQGPSEKIQSGVAKALINARKKGHAVVSITSDLPGSTGVAAFRKEFPQASYDVGVAESNMISTAAGLSKLGLIPVVDTFAQFGVTKGALPLTMAALSEAPVIAVFSHTGFQDAADGASHQALAYLAMTCSIPHVDVYCLSCSQEADVLLTTVIEEFAAAKKSGQVPNSAVFFLGRENFPSSYGSFGSDFYRPRQEQVVVRQPQISSAKNKFPVVICTSGSLLPEAIKASDILQKSNIAAAVVHKAHVNYFSAQEWHKILPPQSLLVTLDDHQRVGGLGQILAHALLTHGFEFKLLSLAVEQEFGRSAYSSEDLYKAHGLDAASVAKSIQQKLV